mgnify:CR=1 FL=1
MQKFIVKLTEKAKPIYIVSLLNSLEKVKHGSDNNDSNKICPYCKGKAYYLHILGKYYCFNCKKYIS